MYDPGSNVSLIQRKIINKLNKTVHDNKNYTFNTIGGANKENGLIFLSLKINKIEKKSRFFVIDKDNFRYDALIGLDLIKSFKLAQDHNLVIHQFDDETGINIPIKENNKISLNQIQINFNEGIPIDEFNVNTENLSKYQKNEIEKILNEYENIFAKNRYDVGNVTEHTAQIKLIDDTKFIAKKPYRCSWPDQLEIEKQIKNLLNNNLIEESSSPFAAPVTLAFRKESEGQNKVKERMCVDFRELNKLIIPESYPFPLIEDLITLTQGCKWFTTLDINSAFWSIPIRYADRQKTGFVTLNNHYQWKCLPFGLKSCPAIFQRILAGIIRKHKLNGFSVNYLDDILIFSKTFNEHIAHIRALLNAIKIEGFKLKLIKCSFAKNKVTYLGHVIENNTIKPLMDNLKSIREFPTPLNRKNVRQFLGKLNFYLKFIPNSKNLLEPFHNLLRKGIPFIWDDKCKQSFNKSKAFLMSAPTLAIFNRDFPIYIYSDASLEGMGAILKQPQPDGSIKPVAYFSKRFPVTQKNKKAIYLECIAIKEAIKRWQYWLLGNHFKVFTDHKPLAKMNVKVRTDEELGDLTSYLSQFDFEIIYRPGIDNEDADCLSRNPVNDNVKLNDVLQNINNLSLEEIKKDQNNINGNNKIQIDNRNNIKYKYNTKRLIISEELGITLIERVHNTFGHIGAKCMTQLIRQEYYFKNMDSLINDFTRKCITCIKNKTRGPKKIGTLGLLGPATKPFEIMSLDTIGGFGGRRSTKKYLHLLVDHFTRYAFTLTSSTQGGDFQKLIEKVQNDNDIKLKILFTDNHPGFTSNKFQNFINKEKIENIFTAVDCAFSNGLNERLNQTLVNRIRCKLNDNQTNKKKSWATAAAQCTKEYNLTVHSSTGFAPSYLMYGDIERITPWELNNDRNLDNTRKLALENKRKLTLENDRKTALENSIKAHQQNANKYNKNKKELKLTVGDEVFVEMNNKLNRSKLDEIRQGPFKITKIISDHIIEIETDPIKEIKHKYHVCKITPLIK